MIGRAADRDVADELVTEAQPTSGVDGEAELAPGGGTLRRYGAEIDHRMTRRPSARLQDEDREDRELVARLDRPARSPREKAAVPGRPRLPLARDRRGTAAREHVEHLVARVVRSVVRRCRKPQDPLLERVAAARLAEQGALARVVAGRSGAASLACMQYCTA